MSEAGDVVQRQRNQGAIVGPEPKRGDLLHVGAHQVAVTEQSAARHDVDRRRRDDGERVVRRHRGSRSGRSVERRQRLPGAIGRERRHAVVERVPALDAPTAVASRERRDRSRVGDERARPAALEQARHLLRLEPPVERNRHQALARAGEQQLDVGSRVERERGDAVAGVQPARGERAAEPVDPRAQVREAALLARFGDERDSAAEGAGVAIESVVEIEGVDGHGRDAIACMEAMVDLDPEHRNVVAGWGGSTESVEDESGKLAEVTEVFAENRVHAAVVDHRIDVYEEVAESRHRLQAEAQSGGQDVALGERPERVGVVARRAEPLRGDHMVGRRERILDRRQEEVLEAWIVSGFARYSSSESLE